LKKKLIMAVVALLVLGAGGFFGFKWWTGRKAAEKVADAAVAAALTNPAAQPAGKEEDDDEEEAPAGGGEGEGAAGPSVMAMKGLIVNLDRKNAFLKCEVDVLFRDPELGKLATSEKPTPENSIIRAIVLDAVSGKTVEEASDMETRETIRQEIKEKLNEKFASRMRSKAALEHAKKTGKAPKPPIRDVLIVDWALQQ
jgi:flagellar basal body-associated protein FliL